MTGCLSTTTSVFPQVVPAPRPGLLQRLLTRLLEGIVLARSRRDLAALNDRALSDIGIDRATAIEESSKPIWRTF